jgi:CheY-like chemotaxis protein
MTALIVVFMFVALVLIDVGVRAIGKRADAARERRIRRAALETSLQLTIAGEAKSLKRAEVPNARARILAVDDEPIVLDSFRKILVLAGYSVDTVENGPEALHLVRANAYDFVFTDLKMPEMDGVEVVKAVKHLRPDVDVAVITGFATIETAVATMQYGAADYVQKPFTEEELVAFADRLLIRRQARLEAQRKPAVRVVAPAVADLISQHEYCVPGGAFLSPGHTWARIDPNGMVWVGLDDFARKLLKKVDRVELPEMGARIQRGGLLFVVRRGDQIARFQAPVSGQVTQINPALAKDPAALIQSPYDRGWVCLLQPSNLAPELSGLRIGKPVVAWYQEEAEKLRGLGTDGAPMPWSEVESGFLGAMKPVPEERVTELIPAG